MIMFVTLEAHRQFASVGKLNSARPRVGADSLDADSPAKGYQGNREDALQMFHTVYGYKLYILSGARQASPYRADALAHTFDVAKETLFSATPLNINQKRHICAKNISIFACCLAYIYLPLCRKELHAQPDGSGQEQLQTR